MRQLLILLGLLTAFAPLTTDMYLPAFSAMASDLQSPMSSVQATVAVFLIGTAFGQLIYGPLSDRLGRKRPLHGGLVLYVLASAGCALATQVEWLLAMRLLQAIGGSAGMVIARAVVSDRFDASGSARALSRMMLVMGVAPILAPLLGGQLLGLWGWRSIFWCLAAYGLLCLLLCGKGLPETWPPHRRHAISWRVRLVGFAELLGHRNFMAPAITGGLAMAVMFAYIAGSPFVFIDLYGVSPAHFGWLFGLNAFGLIAGSQWNARLLRRHAPEGVLSRGLGLLVVATLVLFAVDAWAAPVLAWRLAPLFVAVASLGLVMPNAAALAMQGQGARAGVASALLGSLQFVTFGLGAAMVSALQDGSARAMTGTMLACGLLAWGLHHSFPRRHG